MKLIIILLLLFAGAETHNSFSNSDWNPRITHHNKHAIIFIKGIAEDILNRSLFKDVYPSITIAQAAIESAWGKKERFTLFGMKGEGNAGSRELLTHEYINGELVPEISRFRKYKTRHDAIDDYINFVEPNNYFFISSKIIARKHVGVIEDINYSTCPAYTSKIIKIMDDYDLYYFDKIKAKKENI